MSGVAPDAYPGADPRASPARGMTVMQAHRVDQTFPSWWTMVSADVFLTALAVVGTIVVVAKWRTLTEARASVGVALIVLGLWTGVSLYIADLYTMTILPESVGESEAAEAMQALHLRYSWQVSTASFVLVLAGLGLTIMQLLRQMNAAGRHGRALQESETLLKSIFDNVPVGILIKNKDHIVERPNRTYLSWYGFTDDIMIGRRSDEIEDFQPAKEAMFMNAQEREVLATGQTQTRQVERPFADGKVHTVSITKFPVYDQHGTIVKVGSVSVDLTAQVEARKALAQNQARFRDFAESSSDWLWETDERLRFTYVSERYRDIAGFDPTNFLGQTRREIAAEDTDDDKWHRHDDDLENRRPFRNFRYRLKTADGRRLIVSISGNPAFDDNGRFLGYRGTGTNVTERVLAREALDRALYDAERANKAKSQFLATVSHDLRTPLNAILGFSSILADQHLGPLEAGKYREYANDIRTSAEHLLALVNDLLDISAIEAGKASLEKIRLSVEEIIGDCTRTVAKELEVKNIELETRVPGSLPPLFADTRAIKQVLINLLSNAVKFTPDGGKITVEAKASDHDVEIVITDTGKGIPAERLPEITDPFTTGDRDPFKTDTGWGLGLSIAKSLVELHGGEMDISSHLGKGTMISVSLPIDSRQPDSVVA